MSSANVNVCIVDGTLDSEVRFVINDEMRCDQADFYIMSLNENHKGVIYNNRILCRVMGLQAKPVSLLPKGHKLALDGKLRYTGSIGYVEASNVSL